jgi:Na+-transporting NADH:ubiquinone oxidoreductase subunit NqrE
MWFFGKRRQEAKRILIIGAVGSIAGYIIALIYFYITRNENILSIIELSFIGLLVGAGYSMIFFSLLPKKIRLKGILDVGK